MNDKEKDLVQPIPYSILIDLHKNYRLHKHKVLTDDIRRGGKDKEETKSVHFKIDALRDFFKNALEDDKVSGVRIYFCAYDDEQQDYPSHGKVPKNSDYVSKVTVGLVTTTKTSTGKHKDYYPVLKNLLVDPVNHGELCPPNICPPPEDE
jgi:hypothetical protein